MAGQKQIISQILPDLYLSSVFAAKDEEKLKVNNITHVLSLINFNKNIVEEQIPQDIFGYLSIENFYKVVEVRSEDGPKRSKSKKSTSRSTSTQDAVNKINKRPRHFHIYDKLPDVPQTADLLKSILPDCIKYIHKARISSDQNNVLVHCIAGKSRSATVIIVYLMIVTNTSFESVYKKLKSKRVLNVNIGYEKMMRSLCDDDFVTIRGNISLTEEEIDENNYSIPGTIRKPINFLNVLIRFIESMISDLKQTLGTNGKDENPNSFIFRVTEKVKVKEIALRHTSIRLKKLIKSLKIKGEKLEQTRRLVLVATFATLVSTYEDGFRVIIEVLNDVPNYKLVCTDAAIAIRPIFEKFKTTVITSGTLSPFEMYKDLLDFDPGVAAQIQSTYSRSNIKATITTRGNDQVNLTSKFDSRTDPAVVRNYGLLLVELSKVIPDGMVAFFSSYSHLEYCCEQWYQADGGGKRILESLEEQKLIFVEISGSNEDDIRNLMTSYKLACQSGRGAILLAVARGRVSEGLDFANHLARCVVVLGMPFTNTQSLTTKVRLKWLREVLKINETDWLLFDACRHATQCLGRSVRGKQDYSLMVLADKRFQRADRINKMPYWLVNKLDQGSRDLTIEETCNAGRIHMRNMGEDDGIVFEMGLGVSILSENYFYEREDLVEKCMDTAVDV